MRYFALLLLLFVLSFTVKAQPEFFKTNFIPITENGKTMLYPWVGGFNNAQFSSADINNDGIEDLVVFDRVGNVLVPFINGGTPNTIDYEYAPEYALNFPLIGLVDTLPIRNWLLMKDYDCDGISDLFCSSDIANKIYYYKGYYNSDDQISFEFVDYLKYKNGSNWVNIYVSSIDIPAIEDINGDGDLDVLAFNILGGYIDYYENYSEELTGTCGDTVHFNWQHGCWGYVFETGTYQTLRYTDENCLLLLPDPGTNGNPAYEFRDSSGGQANPRHAGSTLLAYDQEGDGDMDMILGDLNYTNISGIINGGTPDSAVITSQDTIFPAYDVTYEMDVFPAAFLADVNNDGLEDLFIMPNTPRPSNNFDCIWYYQNVGDTTNYDFEFKTDTFFNLDNIDLGEDAYPAFLDYNADGLLDFVVGNFGYYTNGITYVSTLALFENIGTVDTPKFELVNRNYLDVANLGIESVHPAFGDIDADGDVDLIVGRGTGSLLFFNNTAGAGNTVNFVLTLDPQYADIDVGQNSAPIIYDLNKDQLPDLVIGNKQGIIYYYENAGTANTPIYKNNPTNMFLGRVVVKPQNATIGNCRPTISRLDSTNEDYLICGNSRGVLKVFEINIDSIYSGSFNLLVDNYSSIDVGDNSALAIADLNDDNKLEMLVGNKRGGLELFSEKDSVVGVPELISSNFGLKVYPNPTDDNVTIEWQQQEVGAVSLQLFDVLGNRVYYKTVSGITGKQKTQLNLNGISAGIYMVILNSGHTQITTKIVLY